MGGRARASAVVRIMMRSGATRLLLVNLGARMMKQHVQLAPSCRVDIASDGRRRVSTVRLPDMRRNVVDVHWRERGVKRPPTRVVEDDGRWRTTSERSWGRTPRTELWGRRHRYAAIRAARISSENRSRTTSMKHKRWASETRWRNDSTSVGCRVHILWWWCGWQLSTRCLRMLQHLEPLGDRPVVLV